MSSAAEAARRGALALEEHHARLLSAFGWTHVDVTLRVEGEALVLEGTVALERMIPAIEARVRAAVAGAWPLSVRLEAIHGQGWFVPESVQASEVALWRGLESGRPGRGLVTELTAELFPVQRLARAGEASLVRARDGTVGWTEVGLEPGEPRPLSAPDAVDPGRLASALRAYGDATYRLGGRTRRQADCSGLVQAAWWAMSGVMLPRHSTDQLAVGSTDLGARPPERPRAGLEGSLGTGDLVFVWADDEAPGHVGLVVTSGDGSTEGIVVVHASRSRGRVMEDGIERFTRGASRIRVVPARRLVGFGAAHAGAHALPEGVIGRAAS